MREQGTPHRNPACKERVLASKNQMLKNGCLPSPQRGEDSVQDEALVDGRAAASGSGLRWGDERLNLSPLFVYEGQVVLHELVQCLVFLSKK